MLSFTQEPFEMECYIKIPKDIEVQSYTEWLIKVNKNIDEQRQAGIVWNKSLVKNEPVQQSGLGKAS